MTPTSNPPPPSGDDYRRVEAALAFLEAHRQRQPELAEVAAEVGLSPFHFQRLFRRWAGVSPKRFLQYLTVEHAKELLDQQASLLDAALDSGLSGPSRLHDHFVSLEAVTPGDYKRRGEGLVIRYGCHATPFGPIFLATTERGICRLAFLPDADSESGLPPQPEPELLGSELLGPELKALAEQWPDAALEADQAATDRWARRLLDLQQRRPTEVTPLLVQGTNFQLQVWRALLRIPAGGAASYRQIAQAIGRPGAARAVGRAVGANPVALLIPCHRVIQALGPSTTYDWGGYRWGTIRKQALLGWEAARRELGAAPPAEGIQS
ncbi:MAG: methylated-DNA--[protein]-cysteine S-methyltransferase [Acidobacteriota bacterium]|nr:methylated-DNA--[protein]-cysteine S-methyltransferase [Acidobacteriota bacterium]